MPRFGNEKIRRLKSYGRYCFRTIKILNNAGRLYMVPIIFTCFFLCILPVIELIAVKRIMNSLQGIEKNPNEIFLWLSIYILVDIIQGVLLTVSNYCEQIIQLKGNQSFQMSILMKVDEFSLEDFEDSDTYDLLQRAMKVNFNLIYSFFKSFMSIFQNMISILTYGYILASWKIWMIPLILGCAFVNFITATYCGNRKFSVVKKRSSKERKAWYYQYLLTRDTAYKEIKTFDLGDYFRVKFEHILNEFIVQDKQLLRERSILTFLSSFIEGLVNTILFVYAVVKALEKQILLGDLTIYLRSISNVKSNTQNFLVQISTIYETVLYVSQYFEFIDKRCIQDAPKNHRIPLIETQGKIIPSISICDVSYRYKLQNKYALSHINLKIKGDSLIAFVGTNGSGKSTLIKLLAALYTGYTGEIYLGDKKMSSIPPEQIWSRVGILFQDFMRYELSLRENIALGDMTKAADSKDIKELLEKFCFTNKIDDLDVQLGSWFDNGVQLSGGEWLKVALARACIRDAELYLLDEPNAALDPISEQAILRAFKERIKGKIGIIVSHRIASIKDIADQIIVFNNGIIETTGTHAELLKNSETYKKLFYDEFQNKG